MYLDNGNGRTSVLDYIDHRTDETHHRIFDSTVPAPKGGETVRFGTAETTGDIDATVELQAVSVEERHVVTERHVAHIDLHHESDDVEGSPDHVKIVDARTAPTQELRSPSWDYLRGAVLDSGNGETTVVSFVHDETDEPIYQMTDDDPLLPTVGETIQFGDIEASGNPDGLVTVETKTVGTVYRVGERNYAHLDVVHDDETEDRRWITAIEVRITPANVE